MRVLFFSVALASSVFFAAALSAATVNSVSGQVLVNKGEGYQQVVGSTSANPGDTVVVNPGGSASIVYPDGCVVQVQPGTVATIAQTSPCQAGSAGTNTTTFILGGLAVGGGVAAAIMLGKDKSSSP